MPAFAGARVRCVATSASHSAFVTDDGDVWTCGLGRDGQLGHGRECTREPRHVEGLNDIAAVACGNRHSLALSRDGVVYSFGSNKYGQLGVGDDASNGLNVVDALDNVKCVAAGDDFSVVSDERGCVYTFGSASMGRLGHGDERVPPSLTSWLLGGHMACEKTPRLVKALKLGITRVVCGKLHTVVNTANGGAYVWGAGRHYLLGTGSEDDVHEPLSVHVAGEKIEKVVSGVAHTLVLATSGRVYAWGVNDHGALGIGTGGMMSTETEAVRVRGIDNVMDIAAGWHVSAAVVGPRDDDGRGEVYTWGSVQAGALGAPGRFDVWEPTSIGVRAKNVVIGPGGSHVFAY